MKMFSNIMHTFLQRVIIENKNICHLERKKDSNGCGSTSQFPYELNQAKPQKNLIPIKGMFSKRVQGSLHIKDSTLHSA